MVPQAAGVLGALGEKCSFIELPKTPKRLFLPMATIEKLFSKPKRLVDPDDVVTPAEAKKVRHGMKRIKAGRFKLWQDVKHELGRKVSGRRPAIHSKPARQGAAASVPEHQ
jgi:hypothetical protein